MYSGSVADVTIEFEDSLMGTVQDKFSEHIHIVRISTEKCSTAGEIDVLGMDFPVWKEDGNIVTRRVDRRV